MGRKRRRSLSIIEMNDKLCELSCVHCTYSTNEDTVLQLNAFEVIHKNESIEHFNQLAHEISNRFFHRHKNC